MAESHVLIVDADAERAGRTAAVLAFCDCHPVVAPDPQRALSAYSARKDWTLAIIGEVADFEGWRRFLDALRAGTAHPPLLLLGDRPGSVRERGLGGVLAWPLDEPIRNAQLSEYLRRASHRRAEAVSNPPSHENLADLVAELSNLVKRLSLLHSDGVVGVPDLAQRHGGPGGQEAPPPVETREQRRTTEVVLPEGGLDLKATIAQIEVDLISHALQRAGGVVARAAQTLRMRRTTLVEKLRKYGLDRAAISAADLTHPKAH